ncbi:acetoacetate decarboxylase family protein [Neobacillus rhizophilus]|uniref:Acetoacetate decarboxylase family protein n=1 Tax=Neobacillus rhizophilus TaxID=2833579 RepID=A0A942U8N1_9BACI|nr:acetoacetate decarboxylase family protein [Neobacillus rhizophilus]MBS4214957.1 acetoacetate decarboxylase family protein [Neobacillus rhizophilus]
MPEYISGKLKPENFGFVGPVNSPPIDPPPYYFRGVEALNFVYETDSEAAAAILPEGLMLPEKTATAVVTFNLFHFSTVGCYGEAIFGINCFWENEPVVYYDTILVDNEVGLITGREPYGFSKLFANIQFERENNLISAYAERPTGKRLITGVVRPRDVHEPTPSIPAVTLKVIPSPEEGAPPEVCELVMVRTEKSEVIGSDGRVEVFTGPGNITFDSNSVLNPFFKLPIQKMVRSSWGKYNYTLPYGKVIKRYEPKTSAVCDPNGVPQPRE